MTRSIGIMGEHKAGEHRIPLTPGQLQNLQDQNPDLKFTVQPSDQRVFQAAEFAKAGIAMDMDLSKCPLVLAVKEIDVTDIHRDRAYLFFSHTIKGQDYNMDMLQHILDVKATLLDYELIKNEKDQRLVFFGRHAGLAGMIDTLRSYGQRTAAQGAESPFMEIKQALDYADLEDARSSIASVGEKLSDYLREREALVIGVTGYGNVSKGAQEIIDLLPVTEISPEALLADGIGAYRGQILKVVFHEEHMVRPRDAGKSFDLQEYYDHPEHYTADFEKYLPLLSMLVNCIYWDTMYTRLLTKEYTRQMSGSDVRLKVVGDITCDIEGAVECNLEATHSDNPVYVYHPESDSRTMGFEGKGLLVLAVDNLPTELPREASDDFGRALTPKIPALARCDFTKSLNELDLPDELKNAIIAHQGELAPEFEYLNQYL